MMLVDEYRTAAATMANIAAAMPTVARRLEEMRRGYPPTTVGASTPDGGYSVTDDRTPDRDADVKLTRVEQDALSSDRVEADTIELRKLIVQHAAITRRIDTLCTPYRLTPTTARAQALSEAPKDWCTSCYRDGQHHEPVTVDARGHHHYDNLCRWCGDFQKEHGTLPPMPVLRARHEGRRVTVQLIERHIRKGRP